MWECKHARGLAKSGQQGVVPASCMVNACETLPKARVWCFKAAAASRTHVCLLKQLVSLVQCLQGARGAGREEKGLFLLGRLYRLPTSRLRACQFCRTPSKAACTQHSMACAACLVHLDGGGVANGVDGAARPLDAQELVGHNGAEVGLGALRQPALQWQGGGQGRAVGGKWEKGDVRRAAAQPPPAQLGSQSIRQSTLPESPYRPATQQAPSTTPHSRPALLCTCSDLMRGFMATPVAQTQAPKGMRVAWPALSTTSTWSDSTAWGHRESEWGAGVSGARAELEGGAAMLARFRCMGCWGPRAAASY